MRSRVRRFVLGALLGISMAVGAAGAIGTAFAQARIKLAVVPLVGPEERETRRVSRVIRREAQGTGRYRVDDSTPSLGELYLEARCAGQDAHCVRAVAKGLRVDALIIGRFDSRAGSGRLELKLYNAVSGDTLRQVQGAVRRNGADAAVARLVRRLLGAEGGTASTTVRVASVPSGARVFIDGEERGVTPVLIEDVTAGAHELRIEHDGYYPFTRQVSLSAEEPNRFEAGLIPIPPGSTTAAR